MAGAYRPETGHESRGQAPAGPALSSRGLVRAIRAQSQHPGKTPNGATSRPPGALTITRAAPAQREIDALADPLTIALSQLDRMDTVGAWIVYRAVRDRGA